jgi:MFS family permease
MDSPTRMEWQRGWPVVLGTMLCAGFGIPLFYYVFSLFIDSLTKEFGVSRGQMSFAQALIVLGALFAPAIGRMMDRWGFRRVFTVSALGVAVAHFLMAGVVSTMAGFAFIAFLYGAAGIACGPLGYTRPLAAWFWHSRGLALGVSALGLALTALFAPKLLAALIADYGWRAGFLALAAGVLLLSVPATLLLVREAPPEGPAGPKIALDRAAPVKGHFAERDFWLLALSMICVAIPGAGLLSAAAPVMAAEGITQGDAAYAISAYALGQIGGRVIAGWFLDRANPRIVAFAFTFLPASGFLALWSTDLSLAAAVIAIGLVGIQQGAEIDLFAWFTARRFGLARYGTVYGWIIAVSWIGNAAGILFFGLFHDFTGNYALAELIAAGLLTIGAILIALVRVEGAADATPSNPSHIDPLPSQAP